MVIYRGSGGVKTFSFEVLPPRQSKPMKLNIKEYIMRDLFGKFTKHLMAFSLDVIEISY